MTSRRTYIAFLLKASISASSKQNATDSPFFLERAHIIAFTMRFFAPSVISTGIALIANLFSRLSLLAATKPSKSDELYFSYAYFAKPFSSRKYISSSFISAHSSFALTATKLE